MMYILLTIIVILEAVEDGLREEGKKKWSKRIEGLYKLLFFLIPCFMTRDVLRVYDWNGFLGVANYSFVLLVLWASIRAYLFDPIMHVLSGWDINTIGITSPLWDDIMKKLPGWKVWVWRIFWLAFSIFWYYKAVKGF
jgi:hypothetical protein